MNCYTLLCILVVSVVIIGHKNTTIINTGSFSIDKWDNCDGYSSPLVFSVETDNHIIVEYLDKESFFYKLHSVNYSPVSRWEIFKNNTNNKMSLSGIPGSCYVTITNPNLKSIMIRKKYYGSSEDSKRMACIISFIISGFVIFVRFN